MVALTTRPKIRDLEILDQYGTPIGSSAPRRMVAAPNPRGMQTYSSHPEIGLTVEALLSYHRLAEAGSPTRQMDMWDGLLERHAEARGMFNERNEDVAGCDFCVMPPPNRDDKPSRIAAAALEEYLQYNVASHVASPSESPATCFRTYLEHQLTAVPVGFACSNIVWDYIDKLIVPIRFEPIAARRFAAPSAERANEIWLIDASDGRFDMIELEAGAWSVTRYYHRNPFAAGLLRSCDWWMLFALTGFKGWQLFADMFGLPMAIGYYEEGASPLSRDKLEDAVRAIGQDGYAVLSSLTELVIKDAVRGGDSSTVYPQIMRACDQMLTKLITGGTLNTDVSSTGAGSYNAASVHADRSFKMKRRDATRLQDAFAEYIALPFKDWNGYDRAGVPRLHMKIDRGGLQRAQELQILGQAFDLSKSQIQEEHGLRQPSSPEDAVRFVPTAPPDPGHAREDKKK